MESSSKQGTLLPFVTIPLEDLTTAGSNVNLNVQSESLPDNRSDEQPASFNHRRVAKKKCCVLALTLCIAGSIVGTGLAVAFVGPSVFSKMSERTITTVPTDSVLPTVTGQHTPDPMATSPVGIGEDITEPPLPASARDFRGETTAPWLDEVVTELTSQEATTGQHTPDPMATSPVGIGEDITEPPLPASARNFSGETTAPWLDEVVTEYEVVTELISQEATSESRNRSETALSLSAGP